MGKNPLRTGIHSLKAGSRKIRKDYNASVSRALHLAGISGDWNILLGLGKIISGLLSFSGFVCVSGFYTLRMVFARYCALAGVFMRWRIRRIEAENNRKEEEETSDSNSCSG